MAHDLCDQRDQFGAIAYALGARGEARIRSPFRMAQHLGAARPEAIVAGCEANRSVGCFEELVGDDGAGSGAVPLGRLIVREIVVELSLDPMHGRVEQRRIDEAALAGTIAQAQCRQRADRAEHARRLVVDRGAAKGRRILGAARDAHHAAIGLQQRIEARLHAHRALIPEGPDRAVDQSRMPFQHGLRADADLVDDAWPEILDQDVGILAQPMQRIDVGRQLQVEDDGALVAVLAVEVERRHAVWAEGRAPDARIVAAIRFLHLDDVGAHVGQQHAGKRTGQRLAHFDNANSFEW